MLNCNGSLRNTNDWRCDMERLFIAVKKEPDEFCAEGLPWKATNGVVCADEKTKEEARATADRLNRERGFKAC